MAATSGRAIKSSAAKHAAIKTISEKINASKYRKPLDCKNKISNVSSAVKQMPIIKGMWSSNCKAIAVPIISAKSQAQIAISHKIHRTKLTDLG